MPKRTDIKKILIIGSGPIVIGQACEFDYSGTQACKVLREEGYQVVLVNSNPATIMTDPEFSDRTYIEPLLPEFVERIIDKERPEAVLPTLGGQTALNLAIALDDMGVLERYGIEMIGADREAIEPDSNPVLQPRLQRSKHECEPTTSRRESISASVFCLSCFGYYATRGKRSNLAHRIRIRILSPGSTVAQA